MGVLLTCTIHSSRAREHGLKPTGRWTSGERSSARTVDGAVLSKRHLTNRVVLTAAAAWRLAFLSLKVKRECLILKTSRTGRKKLRPLLSANDGLRTTRSTNGRGCWSRQRDRIAARRTLYNHCLPHRNKFTGGVMLRFDLAHLTCASSCRSGAAHRTERELVHQRTVP
jgi:hypothetical protein